MMTSNPEAESAARPEPGWVQRLTIGRNPRRTFLRLVVLIVLAVVISKFVLLPIRVSGISMEPTYRNGRVDVVNRLAYVWSRPRRGDVVGIRLTGEHAMFMKRIIGLPGERLAIVAGKVMIDGEPLAEPYAMRSPTWFEAEARLGPDEYFVIGDNRTMISKDDHEHGRVDGGRILGKVVF